jgi:beta-lactamase class D
MKKIILFLSIGLLFSIPAIAEGNCFLVKEADKIIINEGECKSRHASNSTFKIAISLMGYNEGILIDETHPELPFKEGYEDYLDKWKHPHNPSLWMKNSCVWFSQYIVQKLGMSKFQEYVKNFDYGNQDVKGYKNKDNGLKPWISSSLHISPEEQIVFLQKLVEDKLPVSLKSQEMTKNIIYIEDLPGGWKLYGKTGNGDQWNKDRTYQLDHQFGWFVGWVQKGKHTIVFANYIEDKDKQDTYASLRAKEAAKKRLMQIVQNYN